MASQYIELLAFPLLSTLFSILFLLLIHGKKRRFNILRNLSLLIAFMSWVYYFASISFLNEHATNIGILMMVTIASSIPLSIIIFVHPEFRIKRIKKYRVPGKIRSILSLVSIIIGLFLSFLIAYELLMLGGK